MRGFIHLQQCSSDFSSSLAVDMEFVQFAFSLLMKMVGFVVILRVSLM